MERILNSDLKNYIGQKVKLVGWIDKIRSLGGINFVVLRDRSGTSQIIVDDPNLLKENRSEDIIYVEGVVREEKRAPGGLETQLTSLKTINKVEERGLESFSIKNFETSSLDTILDHRALSIRNPKIQAIFKVQAALSHSFADYLIQQGFVEIHTPKIVSWGTEGGSELFQLNYFGKQAFLAQSPQFYKQMMVGSGLERVFEIGPVFRAEKHNTSRHLNEYTSMDFEMGFIDNEQDIIRFEEDLLKHMFIYVKEKCSKELKIFNSSVPKFEKIYQLKLREAQEILESKGKKSLGEKDLDPEGEKMICEYIKKKADHELVYITNYPIEKRPFYTMPDPENPNLTRSFDLLYKGLEITTGGQRIHDYQMLVNNIMKFNLDPKDFESYLDIFKYSMPLHGGLAIGLERLTMKLLNLDNIKEATMFPRDRDRLTP